MTTPARFPGLTPASALAALLCSASPAAFAQTVTTAAPQASGISQEQALSLAARLDALEKRNEELEAQLQDLKAQSGAQMQQVRDVQSGKSVV